ncbi:MAG: 30S ribosomal protein S12 methylthiotransferase RimO [Candidatus Sericytochromatia bacterium]|nr:30S ribosomal protein S12 methylthiotransferase RimO [Candidatus Tanganyikabacteria bacterium]
MTRRVGMVSLGCSKNTVDSENMLGLLTEAGYEVVGDERAADVVVVNTCSFVGDATQESVRTILELGQDGRRVVVAGCLAQRHQEELLETMPEISAVIGTGDFGGIVDVVRRVDEGERFQGVTPVPDARNVLVDLPRRLTGLGPSAYLKIAEGCDHVCTFCIIPQFRGRYVSREKPSILAEARRLVAQGVREIVLIAEDTTRYGQKETGKFRLPQLLADLDGLDGLAWIRILYAYPNYMTNELLEAIRDLPKVLPYLDVPLQHTHPDMLKAMKRPRHEPPAELVARMRSIVPEMALRTTFITGFPGETEEHAEHVLDFVRQTRLDHVGAFAYSPEKGTPGATMKPVVPKRTRVARQRRIMEAQQAISLEHHQALVGRTLDVLVEGLDERRGRWIGRTYRDAPEIDGLTFVRAERDLEIGSIVPVRVTEAAHYDFHGVAL